MTGHAKSEHWFAHFISVCTHHLPAALMVTAVVFICDHKLHWLKAIEGYAFLGIGNLTALDVAQDGPGKPTVSVVLIDQQAHEDFYLERSPLDRCALKKDLEAIYNLVPRPKLLVVDLDLSPAFSLLPRRSLERMKAKDCDMKLLNLLMKDRNNPKDGEPIHTVLIAPFEMLARKGEREIGAWRRKLERNEYISFAEDPTISVSFGLVNDLDCDAKSVAVTAFEKYPRTRSEGKNCWDEQQKKKKAEEAKKVKETEETEEKGHIPSLIISPKEYLSGLSAVGLCQLPSRHSDRRCKGYRAYEAVDAPSVFFVGTSFGDSDTFLTPLGIMYGVEVHAAGFMSLLHPTGEREWIAFALDVVLGLVMGGLIGWSWRTYFSRRFSSSAFQRQMAPGLIMLLTLGFVIVVAVLTGLSYLVLRHCGIWLSPIPMAVGMLIESFFNSAIGTAVKEGYEQRQALIRRLQTCGPDSFASQLALEAEQHPHQAHSLKERAARFIYLDISRLWGKGKYGAFTLLLIRRLTFVLVLLLVLFWNWFVSKATDFYALVAGLFH